MGNNLTSIKERILYVAKIKGVRMADFCKSIGQTYGNYKGENLKTAVSSDVLAKLLTIYPDVNTDFLLRGTGEAITTAGQVAGHSLSISGDNHGTNMIGLSTQELHTSNGASSNELVRSLMDEIAYLRELVSKRDEQMIALFQKTISSKD